jgi:pyridoxal phosphate enzyme (YggS family)
MKAIEENLKQIRESIPEQVVLVAVSKTKPISDIFEAYQAGQRDFGENKAQEMQQKAAELPQDIHWHFIVHLQTNKVKYSIQDVHLIHGMDRPSLFQELEKQAAKINRKIQVLLQFHIAEEETKFGFDWEEVTAFLSSSLYQHAQFVEVVGVMGMATFTSNEKQISGEFERLKSYFDTLKQDYFNNSPSFSIISMGMSGDYPLAISAGSNMIRVGSAIFGSRN